MEKNIGVRSLSNNYYFFLKFVFNLSTNKENNRIS